MKIVIELTDEQWECVKNGTWCGSKEILDGIPLPKGHGRLIEQPTDADIAETIGGKNDFADCIREAVATVFENAKTVVEADGGDVPDINIGKIGKDATATDCVKRQDVEDAIYDYSRSCDVNYAQIMEFIDKLPSVQPKIGHWVKVIEENGHAFYLCSVCKEGTDENYDWCPFCGCKMQEVEG